jgi:hypothetical protein
MRSIGFSIGMVVAALFVDIVVLRSDLKATITTIFLLCVYRSNDGFASLLNPKFWSLTIGAVAPWILMVAVLLAMAGLAKFMPDVSSDARGGIVMFAVLPAIVGLGALVVGMMTALYRLPEGTITEDFFVGLKIHNPIFLYHTWFS